MTSNALRKTTDAREFELENFLPYRLSLLSNTISQGISITYRKEFGLSVMEWRVIAILGRFPGLTASEVMERGAMDKVAVSRAVKKLQEKRLVERSEHSADRRRLPLSLSPRKGWALYRKVVPQAMAYEKALKGVLDQEELAALNQIMGKLQRAAGELNYAEA
jgi:DNA-binding MarR family transcriptional regulator